MGMVVVEGKEEGSGKGRYLSTVVAERAHLRWHSAIPTNTGRPPSAIPSRFNVFVSFSRYAASGASSPLLDPLLPMHNVRINLAVTPSRFKISPRAPAY